ncbi:transcriptional regulator with XRE-family HTH domain [Hydrogenispora ethanolica]|uniref:Transcriptional regulator with XRE-family HTH domain n=1 Tax=Hydrogenispora ethanolica TaxID=1082276 RepID=A0A4R1R8X9_HYDET|nr:helix-turn-helix transcriptional regulator [Hydrogenispora ethanolica]TCL62010.1 transcriptional regulator with XRE-family HTH domain [Hydrogenispora ethanolica]
MKEKPETIGARLKFARKIKNLTLPEVSRRTEIAQGNLSVMENDKTKPSADALIKLSELYEVSADWILKGQTEPTFHGPPAILPVLSHKKFKAFLSELDAEWTQGDIELKGWIVVQLRKAFPEIAARIEND